MGPPAFGGRLLPSVVELRPKGLVVAPQLAAVLGPPQQSCGATFRSSLFARPCASKLAGSGPSGHCCTSLGQYKGPLAKKLAKARQKIKG
ncbi:hypothetical protein SGRA_3221 [Saprospira grandis str. Lewin]|uniref:Uncharacterized protein n=1 Tax=Saprospira grandis (strain Lewin) TaxID=984262 RepID=H6L0Z3_SAPGL|nr:hypothetical protein SGRA_3221 [Saprospira grandis str. Lewin]